MDIQHVEIDIDDKRVHAQIAFLVDKQFFLEEIRYLRNEFQIDSLFDYNNYSSWNDHLLQIAGFDLDEARKIEVEIKDNPEKAHSIRESWREMRKIEHERLDELKTNFRTQIATIRETHRYPPLFDDVIIQAVIFNKVGNIKTTQTTIYLSPKAGSLNSFDATLAILITPMSTKEDVLRAYEESKSIFEEYNGYTPVAGHLDKDTLSNIERDRDWYWSIKSGKSYSFLMKEWEKRTDTHPKSDCPNKNPNIRVKQKRCELCWFDDENDIIKAVSRYKKQLKSISPV